MNKTQKLDVIQGLITGYKEQIYRYEQFKKLDDKAEEDILQKYIDSIKEVVNGD